MDTLDPLEALEASCNEWADNTIQLMQSRTPDDTGYLDKHLATKLRKKGGEVYGISFLIPTRGVYIEKGAGRGYGGTKGSRWKYEPLKSVRKSNRFYKGKQVGLIRTTDPSAMGKVGTGKRQPVEWFNNSIRDELPALADAVEQSVGDALIRAIYI